MIDRHGNYVCVAWAEHEILWVKAAMDLPLSTRTNAYRDIASMSGRTLGAIRQRATDLRNQRKADLAIIFVKADPPKPRWYERRAACCL